MRFEVPVSGPAHIAEDGENRLMALQAKTKGSCLTRVEYEMGKKRPGNAGIPLRATTLFSREANSTVVEIVYHSQVRAMSTLTTRLRGVSMT